MQERNIVPLFAGSHEQRWPAPRFTLKVVSKYDRGFHTVGEPVQVAHAAHIEGR